MNPLDIANLLSANRQNILAQSGAPWTDILAGLEPMDANRYFYNYPQQAGQFQQALELVGPYRRVPRTPTPQFLEPGQRTIAPPMDIEIPPIYFMPMDGIGTGEGPGIDGGEGPGTGEGTGTGTGTGEGPGAGTGTGTGTGDVGTGTGTEGPLAGPGAGVGDVGATPGGGVQPGGPGGQVTIPPEVEVPPILAEPPVVEPVTQPPVAETPVETPEEWRARREREREQTHRRDPITGKWIPTRVWDQRYAGTRHDPNRGVEPVRPTVPIEETAYQEELEAGGGPLAPPTEPLPIEGGRVGWEQGLPDILQPPSPVTPGAGTAGGGGGGGGGGGTPRAEVPAFFPGTTIEDVVEGTLSEGEGTGSLEIPPTPEEPTPIRDAIETVADVIDPGSPLAGIPPGINIPVFGRGEPDIQQLIMSQYGDGQPLAPTTPTPTYTPEQASQWQSQLDRLSQEVASFEGEREATTGQDPFSNVQDFFSDPEKFDWGVQTGQLKIEGDKDGFWAGLVSNPLIRFYIGAVLPPIAAPAIFGTTVAGPLDAIRPPPSF